MQIVKYFLPLLMITAGYLVGVIYLSGPENNYIKDSVLNNDDIILVNDYSKSNAPFNFQNRENKKNILVFMDAACNMKAQALEKWYDFSKKTESNIFVILDGELSYYLNYLLYEERMFSDSIAILNNPNTDNTFMIENHRVSEAVFIVDNNGLTTNSYHDISIPDFKE